MIELHEIDRFEITDRGTVITTKNPDMDNPGELLGQIILIDGEEYKVRGVEMFRIALPYPHQWGIGILI